MARPSNTETRRTEIVDALLTVLGRKGWASATIAEIARAAGILPGLVHYHFESKHEVLVALVQTLVTRVEARAERLQARAGDEPRARLDAYVEAYVGLGDDADPRAVGAWVIIGAEAVREPEVRALYTDAVRASLERLHQLVLEVLRAEGRQARNASRIAAAILSAIEGAYRVSAAAPGVLPEGYAYPTLRRMIDGLVAAEERR